MPEWVVPTLIGFLAGLVGLIYWKLDGRQEKFDEKLDALGNLIRSTDQAVLAEKMVRAEKDINDLRAWKHAKADPYIGAMNAMKDRVDSLWRKVFNGPKQ